MRSERLDVARDDTGHAIGFTLVSIAPSGLYLDQVSVHPDHGKKGIGTLLMNNLTSKARKLGQPQIILSTFRDVPWNAPFYARLGYRIIRKQDYQPFMIEIETAQRPFMDVSKRVFMRKRVRKSFIRANRNA